MGRLTQLGSDARATVALLRSEGRGGVFLVIAFGWLLIVGLRFTIPAILPFVRADLGLSKATAGLALSVVWATYALMQFPAGLLIDRLGERRLMTLSLLGATVSMVAFGLSTLVVLFFAGCVIFGLGTGIYGSPRGTVLTRLYPDNSGTAIGTTLAVGNAGAAVLPAVAGLLVPVVGWRPLLGALAVPFALFAMGSWRAIPERAATRDSDADRASAGDVLAALRPRPVAFAVLGSSLMLLGFQGVTSFLTTYLVEENGMAPGFAASLYALVFVSGAVAQQFSGVLADRFGGRRVLLWLAVGSIPPLVLLPLLDGATAMALLAVWLGVRIGIAPVGNAYIIPKLPAEVQGTSWGLARMAFFLVGSAGSTVVGTMAGRGFFDEAFYLLAAITAVAAFAYYAMEK